jgi:hypothetical protein
MNAIRPDLHELRCACRDYPRSDVVRAIGASLQELGIDSDEGGEEATLIAAWLLDDELGAVPPPLPAQAVERIRVELRQRGN